MRALKQEVAEIFPASNLPAFLLQGLLQLEDRTLRQDKVAADLRVLFRGSAQIGIYGALLAAPATILYGYQKLLSLSGKDVESAFPDGLWQFYTEFGLREDAARHCVESVGFQRAAPAASEIDAAASWVLAAMEMLHSYDELLASEWDEKVMPRVIDAVLPEYAAAQLGKKLPRRAADREQLIAERVERMCADYHLQDFERGWLDERPYRIPAGEREQSFARYRRAQFQQYVQKHLRRAPADLRAQIESRFADRRAEELPRYRKQLAMTMTLQPEQHREYRATLPLHMVKIALVVGGRYHLIDACAYDADGTLLVFPPDGGGEGTPLVLKRADDSTLRDRYGHVVDIDHAGRVKVEGRLIGRLRPPSVAQVKAQVAAIIRQAARDHSAPSDTDMLLVESPRARQPELRAMLSDATKSELVSLQYAPIIINWDEHPSATPLPDVRRARRGTGDHALTMIRTDRSMVFDMSHIFCDAVWGMALTEIITGYAAGFYPEVSATRASKAEPPAPLKLLAAMNVRAAAASDANDQPIECAAETTAIDMDSMGKLRRKLAGIQLPLTVNDLLLLGRFVHAANYTPGPRAEQAFEAIASLPNGAALSEQIVRWLEEQRIHNPSLLIPMDASNADPRLRLYPATFRNPLPNLIPRLERCENYVRALRRSGDAGVSRAFDAERKELYKELQVFAELLRALKQVTMRGESFSAAALKLMGHLPGSLQNLVDMIPQKVGILNEILKGREVFSNVGRVAPESSIVRFSSARDDGSTKLLVWGIMTDASGRMTVTLRDFRPHVAVLARHSRPELAQAIAYDYLEAYATSVNELVTRIHRVLSQK